jgi:hypothetical protein
MTSLTETLIQRDDAPRAFFRLTEEMFVERGTKADWDLLHDLHYKAERLPIGPRFWRLDLRGNTIGVLVTGTPKGMLRERHMVFPNMKPGAGETRLTNTNRYHHINKNFRVISRFVIDTMYRGIGAGYKMMNLVSRMEGNTFMEIQSSMSKFNSFGQKAGFRFVKPMNANNYEKVMRFFRANFEASPQDFEAVINEINEKSEAQRIKSEELCRDFYFRNSALENTSNGGAKMEQRRLSLTTRDVVKGIQQLGLSSPMYGVWKCPDAKGTLPDRIPLTAFDAQGANERLVWK